MPGHVEPAAERTARVGGGHDRPFEIDEESVLARAIAKRLDGRIRDRAQFRRLYQALRRQGFPPDRVAAALVSRAEGDIAFVEE